jgi:integrase/recombinase XerD
MPSGTDSATVLRNGAVVEPVDRCLAHLTAIERSPNTVKAYAHDLRDLFTFVDLRGLEWSELRLEDVGRFVEWLRLPGGGSR